MSDTTFEEARRCPKCAEPGSGVGSVAAPNGGKIHTFMCKNSRCRWCDTTYVVQVNADGSIPEPNINRAKAFPALPNRNQEEIDRANQALLNNQLR